MPGQPSSPQAEADVDVSENLGECHVAVGRADVPDREGFEASRGQHEVPRPVAAPSGPASSSHADMETGTGREVRTEEPRQSLLKRPFPSSSSPSEQPSPGSFSTPAQGVKRSADVEQGHRDLACWRVCAGAQMLVRACPMVVSCHVQTSLMRL